MKYKIVKYKPELASQWNDFVQNSANATFLHHRAYMDYHAQRFEDCSLLVYKQDQLLALLPAHQIDKHVFSHKGLTYGGVLFPQHLRIAYKIEIFEALLNYLDIEGIEQLTIKSIPTFFTKEKDESQLYIFYQLQAKLQEIKPFFVLETQGGIQLNKDRKKHLKKLQKQNFILSEDIKYLADFWQIVEDNLAHKHHSKPVHSLQEIQRLIDAFPNQIKLHTIFREEEIISGALVFLINDSLHFQYIHSTTNAEHREGVDWLIWQIINQYSSDFSYISFGSSTKGTNGLDKGLAYWKESYGAHIRNQFIYIIDISKKYLLQNILQ